MEYVDAEAREHAEKLVAYFEFVASEYDEEVWHKGLNTARDWLRLINTDNASQAELLAFIGIVHANRYRSSGWHDLAFGAYWWVKTKGVPVSSFESFFGSEGLPMNSHFYEQTSLEHAYTLLAVFEEYNKEDPTDKAWTVGIELIQEWLRLIETPEVEKSEISALVKRVFDNQHLSKIWFDTSLGICYWCKKIGHLDLIPDDYRSLLANEK